MGIEGAPKNPIIKLIIDIIVYIPCLILNFINYVLLQYKITTKPVWILFGIEIVLIVLYFLFYFLGNNCNEIEKKVDSFYLPVSEYAMF
jgi:hypothetical protein